MTIPSDVDSLSSNAIPPTNDEEELKFGNEPDDLYDEQMDDADARFVEEYMKQTGTSTDAVLCCPACFVIVCLCCQRYVGKDLRSGL